MQTKIFKTLFIFLCLVFLGYLALPNPVFPLPPPDSQKSLEPGDIQNPLIPAYFTDYTRAEVLSWYESQFKRSVFFDVSLPTYLLNYPPEDTATIIRDQVRSTFLQEIVHPLRESIYISGFEPPSTDGKNAINIEGRHWRQKITVRYIPSPLPVRLGIFAGITVLIIVLYNSWKKTLKDLFHERLRIW